MNSYKQMPLWKWILAILGGSILFLIIYAMAQSGNYLKLPFAAKCVILILSGFALMGLFGCWTRLVEKQWFSTAREHILPNMGKGLLTGLVYFCLVVGIMALSGLYKIGSVNFELESIVLPLCLFFVVAVGEEIVFRGVIFRMVDQRWGTGVALIVSALLFGFMHIANPGATVWSSVAIAIEAGLMLGATYKVSDSLWFPIGVHWAWNYIQGPVLGFAVSGGDTPSIISPVINGPAFLTGGEFGAEASIFAAAIGLAISLWFLHFCGKSNK